MNRRVVGGAVGSSVVALMAVALLPAPAQASHHFGDTPYDKVEDAAVAEVASPPANCQVTLTKNKLMARMLSVTWNEVTGGDETKNPAPMTLARSDLDADLFYNQNTSPTAPRRRVFWHPAVGTWQVDDSGLGKSLAGSKFDSEVTANRAAEHIAQQLCHQDDPYDIWYSCDDGSCQADYNAIYTASGSLNDMYSPMLAISQWGGTKTHDCREYVAPPAPPPPTYTCRYVKVANAEGYTGWWTTNVDGGGGMSPLAFPFYEFKITVGGHDYEIRMWATQDTGLSHTLRMEREYGHDSRLGLTYSDAYTICDVDRGICST